MVCLLLVGPLTPLPAPFIFNDSPYLIHTSMTPRISFTLQIEPGWAVGADLGHDGTRARVHQEDRG